jgi:hypothetical protein
VAQSLREMAKHIGDQTESCDEGASAMLHRAEQAIAALSQPQAASSTQAVALPRDVLRRIASDYEEWGNTGMADYLRSLDGVAA